MKEVHEFSKKIKKIGIQFQWFLNDGLIDRIIEKEIDIDSAYKWSRLYQLHNCDMITRGWLKNIIQDSLLSFIVQKGLEDSRDNWKRVEIFLEELFWKMEKTLTVELDEYNIDKLFNKFREENDNS